MPLPKDSDKIDEYIKKGREILSRNKDDPKSDDLNAELNRIRLKRQLSERALKLWSNPEFREKMSTIHKKRYEDPEERRKTGLAGIGHPVSEETRKKIGDSHRGEKNPWYGKHLPAETRKKMSDARKGENHPMWKGGASFGQYCPKFNEDFKERVRAFFGYVCPECGTPQGEIKLAVHHVNYRKGMCCDPSLPHLFIPLCAAGSKLKGKTSCHALTNWNREYWQDYFTDMIMNYYGGRCYLSNKEMTELFGVKVNTRVRKDPSL